MKGSVLCRAAFCILLRMSHMSAILLAFLLYMLYLKVTTQIASKTAPSGVWLIGYSGGPCLRWLLARWSLIQSSTHCLLCLQLTVHVPAGATRLGHVSEQTSKCLTSCHGKVKLTICFLLRQPSRCNLVDYIVPFQCFDSLKIFQYNTFIRVVFSVRLFMQHVVPFKSNLLNSCTYMRMINQFWSGIGIAHPSKQSSINVPEIRPRYLTKPTFESQTLFSSLLREICHSGFSWILEENSQSFMFWYLLVSAIITTLVSYRLWYSTVA